jgi:hypothetical protein
LSRKEMRLPKIEETPALPRFCALPDFLNSAKPPSAREQTAHSPKRSLQDAQIHLVGCSTETPAFRANG